MCLGYCTLGEWSDQIILEPDEIVRADILVKIVLPAVGGQGGAGTKRSSLRAPNNLINSKNRSRLIKVRPKSTPQQQKDLFRQQTQRLIICYITFYFLSILTPYQSSSHYNVL